MNFCTFGRAGGGGWLENGDYYYSLLTPEEGWDAATFFVDDRAATDEEGDEEGDNMSMVCGQLQLHCEGVGIRSGIVNTDGEESLIILPGSTDDACLVKEELARAQLRLPRFFVALKDATPPVFYVTGKQVESVPNETKLRDVYWGTFGLMPAKRNEVFRIQPQQEVSSVPSKIRTSEKYRPQLGVK